VRLVFVDTSAWIALGSLDDQHHAPAGDFFKQLKAERARMVTSDYVLSETYTGLSGRISAKALESFRSWMSSSVGKGRLFLERVEPVVFDKAWEVLMRFYEHRPSYTDCTSLVIADTISADCIFSFDNHFPAMGMHTQPYTPPGKRRN
jgi:predicted nucleic acid-binding protein